MMRAAGGVVAVERAEIVISIVVDSWLLLLALRRRLSAFLVRKLTRAVICDRPRTVARSPGLAVADYKTCIECHVLGTDAHIRFYINV